MTSRRFIDTPAEQRCQHTITLRDGSKAQCGKRRRAGGTLCTQHSQTKQNMTTNQTKIEFIFGAQVTKNNESIPENFISEGMAYIRRTVLDHFNGCTFTAGEGSWRKDGDDGYIVTERSYTLTVCSVNPPETPSVQQAIDAIVKDIKSTFTQEAVAVTVTPVNFSIL